MLETQHSNQFEKDVERARRRGKDLTRLRAVMDTLLEPRPLEPRHHDHKLKGSWIGYRECHVEPDWLLIYKPLPDAILFVRTGTHQDLFGR
jgi:mRNA interferase YafQ